VAGAGAHVEAHWASTHVSVQFTVDESQLKDGDTYSVRVQEAAASTSLVNISQTVNYVVTHDPCDGRTCKNATLD
jgi:hypothetical protein